MNRTSAATVSVAILILLTCGSFLSSCRRSSADSSKILTAGTNVAPPPMLGRSEVPAARNLILIVGDGMGINQIAAGRIALRGANGVLWMETLPVTALVRTQSASHLVTDSAAGASALATGVRVANGEVSIDSSGRPLPTLFEQARARGLSAGLVTTTRITDATPAAFSSHVASRKNELEIARQQASSGVEVLLGCAPEKFLPRARGGERSNGDDLVELLRQSGHAITLDPAAIAPSGSGRLVGLFPEKTRPPLATLTRVAIQTLAHDADGFVLLIESEEIDSASHNNDLPRLIRGIGELDEAVRVALEFAKADGNTLVVVTADHETGGLQLLETKSAGTVGVAWASGKHTGQPVPLYAWGPGSSRFDGEIDNTTVHALLAEALTLP